MKGKKKVTLLLGCVALLACTSSLTSCSANYEKADLATQIFDYSQVYQARGYNSVPHTTYVDENWNTYREVTNVRLIVVPVDFTDYPAESTPQGADGTIEAIKTLCFGEAEETAWQSLRSYYNTSSYGECQVSGIVAPWYHTEQSVEEFAETSNSAVYDLGLRLYRYYHSNAGIKELSDALEEQEGYSFPRGEDDDYLTNDDGDYIDCGDLTYFDANGDYYVDAVVLLYSCPEKVTKANGSYIDNSLYWAWTSSGLGPGATAKNYSFDHFFWTSIYTFYEAGVYENGVWRAWTDEEIATMGSLVLDAHTLVHEFGHIISMYDYYSYDSNSGGDDYYAMGGLDMMDFNIGDHNSVSKSWYGWISPYVIDRPGTLTMRCATTTGDFCIIPIQGKYEDTLCSQYIAIELISNEGVAYMDSVQQLHSSGMGIYPLYYSDLAVRVIHVDARPGLWRYNETNGAYSFVEFRSYTLATSGTYDYVDFACSNTASQSCYEGYKLIETMPSTGRSMLAYGYSSNELLWHEGDRFGYGNVYKDFMMNGNDGSKNVPLGYKFTIDEIDEVNETVTITFKKA